MLGHPGRSTRLTTQCSTARSRSRSYTPVLWLLPRQSSGSREAKTAAQLRHPHIVPIYDAGVDGPQPYIASAYIAGRTLAHLIDESNERGEPIGVRRAAAIVHDLADALHYAHGLGIVHRDIKPANTMLDAKDQAHLMDFGLARFALSEEKLTQDGAILGTPAYMAPEQARNGGIADASSDQYSLGVTLYELLCGQTPFGGPSQILLFNAIHQPPPAPRSLRPTIPRDLETICLKALAKTPSQRYTDCSELAEDLRRFAADRPIRARRISAAERAVRWSKRNPIVAAAVGAVATALVAVAVISMRAYAMEAEQRRQAQNLREIAEQKSQESQAQAVLLERQLYINSVALAQRENLANNVGYAEELLDRCPRALRGWEWRFVNRSNHRELCSVGTRPRPEIIRAVFNPGEDRVACCGGNNVWIYDLASGRQLHHLKGHENEVWAVAWSPDGATIASGGKDKTIRLWNPTTGDQTAVLRDHKGWIYDLEFSRDSRRLVAGAGGYPSVRDTRPEVKLWDYRERRAVHSFPGIDAWEVKGVAFSPDGHTVAAPDSFTGAGLWDVETGEKLRDFEGVHQSWVLNVAFSPDGQMLSTVSADGTAALWDIATGKSLRIFRGHTGYVHGVAFSPDGRRLATGSWDSTIRFWDLATGRETGLFRGHHGNVNVIQFDRAVRDCCPRDWTASSKSGTSRSPPTRWSWSVTMAGRTPPGSSRGARSPPPAATAALSTFGTLLLDDVSVPSLVPIKRGATQLPTAPMGVLLPRPVTNGACKSGTPRLFHCDTTSWDTPRWCGAWPTAPTVAPWRHAGGTAPSASGTQRPALSYASCRPTPREWSPSPSRLTVLGWPRSASLTP